MKTLRDDPDARMIKITFDDRARGKQLETLAAFQYLLKRCAIETNGELISLKWLRKLRAFLADRWNVTETRIERQRLEDVVELYRASENAEFQDVLSNVDLSDLPVDRYLFDYWEGMTRLVKELNAKLSTRKAKPQKQNRKLKSGLPALCTEYILALEDSVSGRRWKGAALRDHSWLSWKIESGLSEAAIRDEWNALPEEDRRLSGGPHSRKLDADSKSNNRKTVCIGIRSAREDRDAKPALQRLPFGEESTGKQEI